MNLITRTVSRDSDNSEARKIRALSVPPDPVLIRLLTGLERRNLITRRAPCRS